MDESLVRNVIDWQGEYNEFREGKYLLYAAQVYAESDGTYTVTVWYDEEKVFGLEEVSSAHIGEMICEMAVEIHERRLWEKRSAEVRREVEERVAGIEDAYEKSKKGNIQFP